MLAAKFEFGFLNLRLVFDGGVGASPLQDQYWSVNDTIWEWKAPPGREDNKAEIILQLTTIKPTQYMLCNIYAKYALYATKSLGARWTPTSLRKPFPASMSWDFSVDIWREEAA